MSISILANGQRLGLKPTASIFRVIACHRLLVTNIAREYDNLEEGNILLMKRSEKNLASFLFAPAAPDKKANGLS